MPKGPSPSPESDNGFPPPAAVLAAVADSADEAIVVKNLDGVIASWNPAAERIFGYTQREAVGHSILMLLPPERLDEEEAILARIREGKRIDHLETLRVRKDGTRIPVSVTISPIRDAGGVIVAASKVARAINDRRSDDRARRLLAAIVASSDDAIISKDLDGMITSWNDGAERIFGYTAGEAIGRSVTMLLPPDRLDEEATILSLLRRGERVDHFETIRLRKTGEPVQVSLTISPIKDDGRVVGASKIARDITALKRIAAEREELFKRERAAREQAERTNRIKDEFLATVSHELRTPLSAIVGWAEVLRHRGDLPDGVGDALDVIDRNARIQAQLINDLLDLGRITAGKMTLNVGWVDIASLVRDSIASVQHAAAAKQVAIKAVLHDDGSGIRGDGDRLQQVVWNLLSNAIKFTPKHGSVTIHVVRVNSHVDIIVADTGIGIAPEFLPHAFDRFRQEDRSKAPESGGLGIGLSLVKYLVELHGGIVRVASPGAGQGTTFTVTLPVAIARVGTPDPTAIAGDGAGALNDLTGIRVLAVDDNLDSLALIRRVLTEHGAEVETASSVERAMGCFEAFGPDVVLSDIDMPVHDGYELMRRLRLEPRGTSVPAAALTALVRAEDRMRVLRAGYHTHIAKPVSPAEVVAVVQSLASLTRGRRG